MRETVIGVRTVGESMRTSLQSCAVASMGMRSFVSGCAAIVMCMRKCLQVCALVAMVCALLTGVGCSVVSPARPSIGPMSVPARSARLVSIPCHGPLAAPRVLLLSLASHR